MCFNPDLKTSIEDRFTSNVCPTTLTIFGTAQILEAFNAKYFGFDLDELEATARTIIKRQKYMSYTWSLTYFCLKNKHKMNFIKSKFFNVQPYMFEATDREVKLYLDDPKFLWRFSMNTYYSFVDEFYGLSKEKKLKYKRGLLTYDEDDSPIMPYLDLDLFRKGYVKSTSKASFNLSIIDDFINYKIKYSLTDYETAEMYYSHDFYLHQMSGNADYSTFVRTILTGHNGICPSPLLESASIIRNKSLLFTMKKEKTLRKSLYKKYGNEEEISSSDMNEDSRLDKWIEKIKKQNFPIKCLEDFEEWKASQKVRCESDEIVEFLPSTALRFLGVNECNKNLNTSDKIQVLNAIVRRNKNLVEIKSKFFNDSNWIEECYDALDNSQIQFYKLTLNIFDFKTKLDNFVYERNGKKCRLPFTLPCSNDFLIELKSRFLKQVIRPQIEYFSKHHKFRKCFNIKKTLKVEMDLRSIIYLKNIYAAEKTEETFKMSVRLLKRPQSSDEKCIKEAEEIDLLIEQFNNSITSKEHKLYSSQRLMTQYQTLSMIPETIDDALRRIADQVNFKSDVIIDHHPNNDNDTGHESTGTALENSTDNDDSDHDLTETVFKNSTDNDDDNNKININKNNDDVSTVYDFDIKGKNVLKVFSLIKQRYVYFNTDIDYIRNKFNSKSKKTNRINDFRNFTKEENVFFTNDDDFEIETSNEILGNKSRNNMMGLFNQSSNKLEDNSNKISNDFALNENVNDAVKNGLDTALKLLEEFVEKLENNNKLNSIEPIRNSNNMNINNNKDNKMNNLNNNKNNIKNNSIPVSNCNINDAVSVATLSTLNISDEENEIDNNVGEIRFNLNNSIDDNSNDENNKCTVSPNDYKNSIENFNTNTYSNSNDESLLDTIKNHLQKKSNMNFKLIIL